MLKCPWNEFKDCLMRECPFWGVIRTGYSSNSTCLPPDIEGCRRVYTRLQDPVVSEQSGKFNENNPCKNCPNHPDNGGSGICHCILGSPKVT